MADKRAHDAEAQRPFLAGESSEDVLLKMKVVEDEPRKRKWAVWVRLLAEVMMAVAIVVLLVRGWQRGKVVEEEPSPVPTCMYSYLFGENFKTDKSQGRRRR